MEPANLELTTKRVINAVENEPVIWDSTVNANKEETFCMARPFRREKC